MDLTGHAGGARWPGTGVTPDVRPDSGSLAKQVVVWCDGRKPEHTNGFWSKFRSGALGCIVLGCRARSEYGVYSGSAPLCYFAYGLHLAEENVQLEQLLALSRRFTALSWRWSGDCLLRIRTLCRHYYVVRA